MAHGADKKDEFSFLLSLVAASIAPDAAGGGGGVSRTVEGVARPVGRRVVEKEGRRGICSGNSTVRREERGPGGRKGGVEG